jgi:hypothetical protein
MSDIMTSQEARGIIKLREQHAQMRSALQRIKAYSPPEKLRKQAEKKYGLSEEEAVEMAYDNVLQEARDGLKGIK